MAGDPQMERVQRSVAFFLREGDPENHTRVGTGVHVQLGGREFVFTAGHIVWSADSARRLMLSVSAPADDFGPEQRLGDGSAGRIFLPSTLDDGGNPDPDVAVVELSDKALLRPDREPYDENSIGFFASDSAPEWLLLAGFPAEKIHQHERIDRGPGNGGLRRLDLSVAGMMTQSMPRIRWGEEPPIGRGVHVFISPFAQDRKEGGTTSTPEPDGMSGGPLARRNGTLVGLARGCVDFEDGLDLWCEPVVEAVRLLAFHEDPAVKAAAIRILVRCGGLKPGLVSTSTTHTTR